MLNSTDNINIQKILSFIKRYTFYKDKELRDKVEAHLDFHTIFIIIDQQGEICAVCMWNINIPYVDVTDCIVREDYRRKDLLRRMLARGLGIWPEVLYLRHNRGYNRDGQRRWSEPRIFEVSKFLRRKI